MTDENTSTVIVNIHGLLGEQDGVQIEFEEELLVEEGEFVLDEVRYQIIRIIIEDVGDSLRQIVRSNQKHLLPKNLTFRLEYIMNQLYLKYGLIHGDITFRNICFKNNQLYLIDFDKAKEIDIFSFDYN